MIDQSAASLDNAQSVIVAFRCSSDDLEQVYALERQLTQAIVDAGAGVYDGHEVALLDGDDAYLFMYGPDAEKLFQSVQPILASASLLTGAMVTLRYGSPDVDGIAARCVPL